MPIQLWKKFFWGLQLTLSVQEKTLLEDYHQSESATLRATTQSPNRPWLHLLMQQPNCPISFVSTVETIDQLMGCLHQSKIQDTPHSKLFFESFEPHSQKCRQQLILWIVTDLEKEAADLEAHQKWASEDFHISLWTEHQDQRKMSWNWSSKAELNLGFHNFHLNLKFDCEQANVWKFHWTACMWGCCLHPTWTSQQQSKAQDDLGWTCMSKFETEDHEQQALQRDPAWHKSQTKILIVKDLNY